MDYVCYIIFSKSLNHYYIGYTSDFETRLQLHNDGFFGGKTYTHKAADWEIFMIIPCELINQAIYVESRIKKMKSRKYIENLKKYPELIDKIFCDYNKEQCSENPCAPSR
jgi:putative endonuclease